MFAAVIFSPGAGQKHRFAEIGQKLQKQFSAGNLITCAGAFGGSYLPSVRICPVQPAGSYIEAIGCITRALLDAHPDVLISVGGDGIASYVADAMLNAGICIPILGVAAGTANVGPLVRVSADELEMLDGESWTFDPVSAVEVFSPGHIAFSVIDLVIGDTFLGTLNGELTNLSAEAMLLYGKKERRRPSADIVSERFGIEKNGRLCGHELDRPGQIIVSALDGKCLRGRAVFGALCSAAYSPCKAAVALTKKVLISTQGEREGMEDFCAVEHLLFGPEDTLTISGFTENAFLIIDGNPYYRGSDRVTLRYLPEILLSAVPVRNTAGKDSPTTES